MAFFALTFSSLGYSQGEVPISIDTVKVNQGQNRDSIENICHDKFSKEFKKVNRYFSKGRFYDAKSILYKILTECPDCFSCKERVKECDNAIRNQKVYEADIIEADKFFQNGEYESAKKLYEKYPNDKYCPKQLKRIKKAANK